MGSVRWGVIGDFVILGDSFCALECWRLGDLVLM